MRAFNQAKPFNQVKPFNQIVHAALLSACLLSACTVGPDYVKPGMDVPAAFKEQQGWKIAQPQDELPRGKWWEVFGDSTLNQLIKQVEVSNQNLRAAEAQYRQAQALAQQAGAAYYPTVTRGVSATRSRSPGNTFGNTNNTIGNTGSNINTTYNLNVGVSWEADLWGSIRRSVEAGYRQCRGQCRRYRSGQVKCAGGIGTGLLFATHRRCQKRFAGRHRRCLRKIAATHAKPI